MSAHTFLRIGTHALLAERAGWIPSVMALFSEHEMRSSPRGSWEYVTTADVLLDRLALQGFHAASASEALADSVLEWQAGYANPQIDALGIPQVSLSEIRQNLREFINSENQFAQFAVLDELSLDPRDLLRVALDYASSTTVEVRYELTDLLTYNLVERGERASDKARLELQRKIRIDAPLVVLTEGSSDSRLLEQGMTVTHPHLVGFLRFMDFGSGAPGSVGQLVNTVRAFVGAGITNRVVALADNDAAARDACQSLQADGLPDNLRVLHYPHLSLLESYPTIGPQSEQPFEMDVNGLAGSLEMYLGEDVLRMSGTLAPVHWAGLQGRLKKYQGSLGDSDKKRIQAAFRVKVREAHQSRGAADADWSGVQSIIDSIVHAFDG